ncbi:MAG: hypothetical protein PHT64_03085, partial [Bacteroidales bacterium]|nr:hypothetical protein [Bacteroidales bacterium]
VLVFFHSPLHDYMVLEESRMPLLESLGKRFNVSVISYKNITTERLADPEKVYIPFIASGGCEEIFQSYGFSLPLPLFFLFDDQSNSLPAALELSSYVSQGRMSIPLIFSEDEITEELLDMTLRMQQTFRKLKNTHIALFGDASPWLLSSKVNTNAISRMLKVGFQNIDIPSICKHYKHLTALSRENKELYNSILKKSTSLKNCTKEDLNDAIRLYQAMDELMVYYSCNALTIKCFDLIKSCNVTACMAISLFNRAGVPAACEGDIPSLLTMIMAGYLSHSPVFMANPVAYNKERNTMDIAHCTVPLNMTSSFALNSHYETGIGVSVEGTLEEDVPYTAVKWIGNTLDRFFVSEGVAAESKHSGNKCRTQMTLRLEKPVRDFILGAMANHILVVKGRHADVLATWNGFLSYLR